MFQRIVSGLTLFAATTTTFAAAFQFYELGAPIVGTAAVGQAVVAKDASTAYYNPAAMTQLQHSEYLLGTQIMLPFTKFSLNDRTTITGDNGGQAATLTPLVNLYYVYLYNPRLAVGISLTTPYGGYLTYNDGWAGRFNVQTLQLYTIDVNPAVSYRFNNWLSFGAGITVEYANLKQTVALPLLPMIDGQANVKVNNTSLGGNLGILVKANRQFQFGVTYRSQISHALSGETTFFRIGLTPNTRTRLVMPQNVIASALYQPNDRFSLLGEVGWANWSSMRNNVLDVAGFTTTVVQNWHDTYRLGIGGQAYLTSKIQLQAGLSYDSSPTNSSHRTPQLPMDRQIRVASGLIYQVTLPASLAFSYEYLNLGHANINNVSSNGVFSGSYHRNFANIFQASINVNV